MRELNEIKKVLYKEKPMAKRTAIYRDGGSTDHEAMTSLGVVRFHVPIQDKRGTDGTLLPEFQQDEIPAQLLIRWLTLNNV